MAKKAKRPPRIRPMSCETCGYHTYGTRGWWEKGFPTCPCGGTILPTKPADLAFAGLIGQEDMPGPMWTAICRENGWEDMIMRRGAAAKSWTARRARLRTAPADHCVYPGCGRWIADGAERCSAGHAQHEDVALEAVPF